MKNTSQVPRAQIRSQSRHLYLDKAPGCFAQLLPERFEVRK